MSSICHTPVNKNWRCCATCVFWSGPREIQPNGTCVLIPPSSTQAVCGKCLGAKRKAGDRCGNFKHILQ